MNDTPKLSDINITIAEAIGWEFTGDERLHRTTRKAWVNASGQSGLFLPRFTANSDVCRQAVLAIVNGNAIKTNNFLVFLAREIGEEVANDYTPTNATMLAFVTAGPEEMARALCNTIMHRKQTNELKKTD